MLLLAAVQPHCSFAIVYLLLYSLDQAFELVRTFPQPFAIFIQCVTAILVVLPGYLESFVKLIDGCCQIQPHGA